jgi:hypothetical protein
VPAFPESDVTPALTGSSWYVFTVDAGGADEDVVERVGPVGVLLIVGAVGAVVVVVAVGVVLGVAVGLGDGGDVLVVVVVGGVVSQPVTQ